MTSLSCQEGIRSEHEDADTLVGRFQRGEIRTDGAVHVERDVHRAAVRNAQINEFVTQFGGFYIVAVASSEQCEQHGRFPVEDALIL